MGPGETYGLLARVRRMESEIRRKTAVRDALRASLLPGSFRYDEERVQTSPEDRMAEVSARVDELERDLEALRRERALLIVRICDAIERLPHEYEKAVLTMFYIGRYPMSDVADAIGYSIRSTYYLRRQGVAHLGELLGDGP